MDGTGDHNCFSKFMLDWITPTVVSAGSQTVSLRASGLYPDALLFMPGAVPGRIFDEFFMVQNRNRSGNDTNLFTGSDGLILWHVDSRLDSWNYDFLYDNSYTEHKLLRLMEADGLEEIETLNALGRRRRLLQGGHDLRAVRPSRTRPATTALPTAMVLTNITGTTTPMSVTVTLERLAAGRRHRQPRRRPDGLRDDPRSRSRPATTTAISRVELFVDTALNQSLTAPPFSFLLDTTALSNGTRTLRAVVYDTIAPAGRGVRLRHRGQHLPAAQPESAKGGQPQPSPAGIRQRPDLEGRLPELERFQVPGLPGRGGRPRPRRRGAQGLRRIPPTVTSTGGSAPRKRTPTKSSASGAPSREGLAATVTAR